jgi:hypothetical protein
MLDLSLKLCDSYYVIERRREGEKMKNKKPSIAELAKNWNTKQRNEFLKLVQEALKDLDIK